jgi:hypothetical protein
MAARALGLRHFAGAVQDLGAGHDEIARAAIRSKMKIFRRPKPIRQVPEHRAAEEDPRQGRGTDQTFLYG